MAASLRRWRARISCRCAAESRGRACVVSRACAAPPGADGLFYRGVHDDVCSRQPRNMPSRQASTKISSSVRPAWTVSWRHSGRRRCNANGPVQCGCGRAPRVTVAMHGGNKCNLFESSHDYRVSYCTRDALLLFFARFRTAGTYVLIGTSLFLSGLPLCQLPCSCGAGVFVLCSLRQSVRSPASSHGANCGSDRQVPRSLLLSPSSDGS